eukprot:2558893-Pyramimonas_sp.AAC.1
MPGEPPRAGSTARPLLSQHSKNPSRQSLGREKHSAVAVLAVAAGRADRGRGRPWPWWRWPC